jgi:hypothetical protein
MSKGIDKKRPAHRWSCAVLAVVGIAAGCSGKENRVASSRSALATSNGLAQNGLTTNGLISNGFWNNGFWNNGFWNNGLVQNGFWNNGFWNNGFWNNGFWNNGFWNNGFWNNGFWKQRLLEQRPHRGRRGPERHPSQELLLATAAPVHLLLRDAAGTYDTTLDPNLDAPLLCTSDANCDVGYACLGGKCVIPLQGAGANNSGLAVNSDGTTWWGSGKCDESCQRWVSACVLARTNAYGVHVPISIRAPSTAPQAVKDALEVTPAERLDFSLLEGAFYGNIFQTTPADPPTALQLHGPRDRRDQQQRLSTPPAPAPAATSPRSRTASARARGTRSSSRCPASA